MAQLAFDLGRPSALGRSDFLVSDCNRMAVGWIECWPAWPSPMLVLHGPPGCGKTHLARIWCARAAAAYVAGPELTEARLPAAIAADGARIALDNADRVPERLLLHLYNCCRERGGYLLAMACRPPGSWEIALPDLRSRLRAAAAAAIGLPDDALLGGILVKHFADRQLHVRPALIAYLVSRIERSFAAAAEIAAALDAIALAERQPVGIALARRIIEARRTQSLPPGSESAIT
jgi:chromosomal replication initiation ATPase DnaA